MGMGRPPGLLSLRVTAMPISKADRQPGGFLLDQASIIFDEQQTLLVKGEQSEP